MSAHADDIEIVLEKNSQAPFTGVLIPEDIYRSQQQDLWDFERLEKAFLKCTEEKASAMNEFESHSPINYFLLGAFLGVIAGGLVGAVK